MIEIGGGSQGGPQLTISRSPIAGQISEVRIGQMPGPVRVRIESNGSVLFAHDCDDPPCHEQFAVPPSAAGMLLEVHATDGSGKLVRGQVHIAP